jgi:Putative zinc-finger
VNDSVDRFRDWDAAYVLGALSADDRRAFERHLQTCPDCAASVSELAGLPGILSKLSMDDAVALLALPDDAPAADAHLLGHEHTPGLVQRLAAASSRRRRRVRIGIITASLAVVTLVSVGGVAFVTSQPSVAPVVAMAPLHQKVIAASLQVTKKGWGTRFDWSCSYSGDAWEGTPESYDLVVTERDGVRTTVATWTTAGPRASGLTASTRIATGDIQSVEIRLSGTTTPLLRENL